MREAVPQSTTQDFITQCVGRCIEAAVDAFREDIEDSATGAYGYEQVLARCESPLEEAFLRCWCSVHVRADWPLTLDGQVKVDYYRLDFVIRSPRAGFPSIAVELDGHEFHEKTKAQVAWRNARDRHLQMRGWKVFHVSGSEFYRDPYTCVSDIHAYAQEAARVCACKEVGVRG